MTLSLEKLKDRLLYIPKNGNFIWKITVGKAKSGNVAGYIRNGYRCIMLFGKHYKCGRLAWFYMTGSWPAHTIDHKNRNKLDDSWDNLRDVPIGHNQVNRKLPRKTIAPTGVVVRNKAGKIFYEAWGQGIGKQKIYLGRYTTPEEAETKYLEYVKTKYGDILER